MSTVDDILRTNRIDIKNFINDGVLNDMLDVVGRKSPSTVKYVSMIRHTLMLLIYGSYPGCNAPHIRNGFAT